MCDTHSHFFHCLGAMEATLAKIADLQEQILGFQTLSFEMIESLKDHDNHLAEWGEATKKLIKAFAAENEFSKLTEMERAVIKAMRQEVTPGDAGGKGGDDGEKGKRYLPDRAPTTLTILCPSSLTGPPYLSPHTNSMLASHPSPSHPKPL